MIDHMGRIPGKPGDAALFVLLGEWAMDEPTRRRILVDNPRILYGFPT